MPRIEELYKNLASLADPNDKEQIIAFQQSQPEVVFVGAEDVLLYRSSRYQKLIKEAEQTSLYQIRLAAEAQGVKQLQEMEASS